MAAEVVYVMSERGRAVDSRWDWRVRCYYADDVSPPKRARELAVETVHSGEASKDVEVQTAQSREDIGLIAVQYIGSPARLSQPQRAPHEEVPDGDL